MTIHICNIRGDITFDRTNERHIYCGRYNRSYNLPASALHNRFKMQNESEREKVINLFRRWLAMEMHNGRSSARREIMHITQLARSGDVWLFCWCHPLPCHTGVVRDIVEEMLRDG